MDLAVVVTEPSAPSVEGDATTIRILDAGYRVLSDVGIRRTTMNQIAEAAGLGVATVYRRFPRKAHLLRAVVLREAATATAAVGAGMGRPASVIEQCAAGFTAFTHAISERPLLVRLLRGDDEHDGSAFAPGELLDQVLAMARDYIAAWIRELQAQGRYLSADPDVVAEIEARLALSLILSPEGLIPMHDDRAARTFATTYLVPLLGPEVDQ